MKTSISFEGLSKHRTIFMGIAILFIMLCHNTIVVAQPFRFSLNIFSKILQCGVDTFLLLSGLGLYYSFRKKTKVIPFWIKRYTKILPPYAVVVLLFGVISVVLLKITPLVVYVYRCSLITFYLYGELELWFVAAILLIYAVFPILYTLLNKHPKIFTFLCIAVGTGSLAVSYLNPPVALLIINEILIVRIPTFLIGMMIAKALLDGKHPAVRPVYMWLVFLISTILIICVLIGDAENAWVLARIVFLPFILSGLLLLTKPLDKINKNKGVYRFFSFLGGITLEIYLLHERILETINYLIINVNGPAFFLSVGVNVVAIAIAIWGAWLLQWIIHFVSMRLHINKPDGAYR